MSNADRARALTSHKVCDFVPDEDDVLWAIHCSKFFAHYHSSTRIEFHSRGPIEQVTEYILLFVAKCGQNENGVEALAASTPSHLTT